MGALEEKGLMSSTGAITPSKKNLLRYYFILNTSNGESELLNSKTLSKALEKHTDLLNQYNAETEKQKGSIMLKYVKALNAL